MTVNSQVSVGTTAVRLAYSQIGLGGSPSYIIKNIDASITVYIGASTVTSVNGYPLPAGVSLSVPVNAGNDLWAVTASGIATVAELGVG